MGRFRDMFSPDKKSFPDGVKVLRDCPDATVDICFIHGLSGNREKTWRGHGHTEPWPKTLLPSKLTRARILTYGYDAYVVAKSGPASTNRLIDHAHNLLNDLTTDRALNGASSRPLIFVAHSLGGLVLKLAILRSRNNAEEHLQGIFEHTKGIIFMGTPHEGSWMADWAKMPASALGLIKSTSVTLLDLLQRDNQLLEYIQEEFWSMVGGLRKSGRSLEIMCFYEELPLPVFGKVVSKESATLVGYNSATIHADHRDMVKFGSVEDNGFKRLLGELSRWESQIRSSIPSQLTQPTLVELRIQPSRSSASDYASRDHDAGLQSYGGHTSGSNASYGGIQNNNTGSGNHFSGAVFNGAVHFGGQGS
ncbi:uncharacterized protein NECHADRAFT_94229 [Fusarium vanettenii 77-13-4]|uniref:NACHT-NTPase sigma domain-containing protein n=1 Tax=Fusarium vanettenii (strain ATCC MYA-4622 / CBS 123669 / FGSC 9596 / NRRL 45880 / 77-13-4) TaxID=660122 RepID=C7Z913_FUSV7|nr:uncharacterized protein NECHADRAFT_94229 [Fusarium vanettenii 77-13-4]EEU38919.1 hypothetical protein NECHADRAFT_94229 [Fusarium vanettenii 77-13-4]